MRSGGQVISRADVVARTFEGFRDGKSKAVETVHDWIRSVVRGGNWRFSDPEGVSQEIMLKLLQIARSDRIRDTGSFQKFVYSVAKHTCVKVYHGERRRDAHEEPSSVEEKVPGGDDPDRDLEQRERIDLLIYVFQRLPASCRELWNWVYREELPAAEVGEKLGISVNNVRVRVHRCLQKARAIHREVAAWPGAPTAESG